MNSDKDDYKTEPDLTFTNIDSFGDITVYFNTDLAGPAFMKQLESDDIEGEGAVVDPFDTNNWRLLQAESSESSLDLNQYFTFVVERGSEDSAPVDELNFIAKI